MSLLADNGALNQATVLVCVTCRIPTDAQNAPPAGVALADATAAALGAARDIKVQRVSCLSNCKRGLSAAIRCNATWTYVFGYLAHDRDGPALVAGARLLAASVDGLMPWRERPESLKKGLIARIPPVDFVEPC